MTLPEPVERAASLFGVLSHPARVHVVALLIEEEPRTVGDLVEHTGVERTLLSHQLRALREARLVTREREGRRHLYRLADAHVAHIVRDALAHVVEPG
ncbi:MAG: helix-turn-helix transcriptional regulator [Myxococcales bacterium]|nr:helix-turn-helix transcriptional regulator [Myxococcales bacterium]MCB9670496.1 helix-turn-helix transcriptional regulator [Alphaproteobacteria bacterium]